MQTTRTTFNCPKCGDATQQNKFGDLADSKVKERHPFVSAISSRVCKPSWPHYWRMGTFEADYNEARI